MFPILGPSAIDGNSTRRGPTLLLLFVVTLGVAGCAETARQAARNAAPAAAESTLDTVNEPDTKRDMAQILSDPRIREATAEFTRSVADGAFDALTDDERVRLLENLTDRMVKRIASSLSRTVSHDLGPAIASMVAESVDQAMARVTSDENQERASVFALALTQAVVRGMAQQVAVEMNTQDRFGHQDPNRHWLAVLARNGGRGAALGLQDAVSEAELRRQQVGRTRGDVLGFVGRIADWGTVLLGTAGLVAMGLPIALVVLLGWIGWRARRYRKESAQREDALLLVAKVIKSAENTEWGDELRDRLRRAAREDAAGNTLRDLLRRHSELRLEHKPEPGWVHHA